MPLRPSSAVAGLTLAEPYFETVNVRGRRSDNYRYVVITPPFRVPTGHRTQQAGLGVLLSSK